MFRFELRTGIAAAPERVFDLSLDPDVHVASMGRSRERVIGGAREPLGPDDEITWQAWHFGVRWRMTSRITEFERPRRFVDEQVRGPFGSFRHEHLFLPEGAGTLMVDRVQLAAPLGALGLPVEPLVGRYLRRLLGRRARHLQSLV